ncbi:MAG TPA: helix-turn-helix domain-containing protein [Pedobacter sp.]|nr:helix-turn-helix domain-containing protein [Pedobacter sp.]
MSSNIRINRICEYCGKDFEAKTTVTRFCSHTCNSRAGKLKIKQLKMGASDQQTKTVKSKPIIDLQSKEFLSVLEVAKLLNSSKHTIYDLIRRGMFQAVNLGAHKTTIKRTEIDKLFNQEQIIATIKEVKIIPLKIKDCYSIGEAMNVSGMSESALFQAIKRNNISKFQEGKFVYVSKKDIHRLINKPLTPNIL